MYVAIVPARGGSKRLPGKNLRKLNGTSLVARAIQCGQRAGLPVTVISEDERTLREAIDHGANTIVEPMELAEQSTHVELTRWFARMYPSVTPVWIAACCPFTHPNTVLRAIEAHERGPHILTATAVPTVAKLLNEDGDILWCSGEQHMLATNIQPLQYKAVFSVALHRKEMVNHDGPIIYPTRNIVPIHQLRSYDLDTVSDWTEVVALAPMMDACEMEMPTDDWILDYLGE